MKLEENWNHLGHQLKGKLHILCGYEDSFYLNRAVKHLSQFLDQAGHDSVEFLPGGHGSFLTKRIRLRILEEMAKHFECMPADAAPGVFVYPKPRILIPR